MIKRCLLFLSILFLLCSCGDEDKINGIDSNKRANLFSETDNQRVEKNLDPTIIGLWRSNTFIIDDIKYQIMWEVTEESTTLALSCQVELYSPKLVQVSAEFENDLVRSFTHFTLKDFKLEDGLIVEDEKSLFQTQAFVTNRIPKPTGRDLSAQNFEDQNEIIEDPWRPVNSEVVGGSDLDVEYYQDSLCLIRIEADRVASKGLLASGMDRWTVVDEENIEDGQIALFIDDVLDPVILQKIQNR